MALGMGRLRIPPHAFWALSLAEWRAMVEPAVPRAMDRRGFEDLLQRYPD
jgi:uncharacterized phage protein (TIGR02216 family)